MKRYLPLSVSNDRSDPAVQEDRFAALRFAVMVLGKPRQRAAALSRGKRRNCAGDVHHQQSSPRTLAEDLTAPSICYKITEHPLAFPPAVSFLVGGTALGHYVFGLALVDALYFTVRDKLSFRRQRAGATDAGAVPPAQVFSLTTAGYEMQTQLDTSQKVTECLLLQIAAALDPRTRSSHAILARFLGWLLLQVVLMVFVLIVAGLAFSSIGIVVEVWLLHANWPCTRPRAKRGCRPSACTPLPFETEP